MLETLNRPLLIIALILIVIALGTDLGSALLPTSNSPAAINSIASKTRAQLDKEDIDGDDKDEMIAKLREEARKPGKPPGWAIPAMGLVDGIAVYGIVMLALPLLISQELHGRLMGLVSLIFSIVIAIASIVLIFAAFIKTLIMIALFTAAPFGTIAYLAIWGFFNRGGATAILSINLFLKLAFAVCLVLAHPRFLQSKGLILMVLTSVVSVLIIGFLHGLMPVFLVSILDMIAAIIMGILALIWAIFLLIGSIFGLVRAVA